MESLVGKTLGAYEIIAELGRGGMAVVYKAYQRTLDRYVVIKVLPPQFAFDAEFVRRFELEAKAAARLKHPNIVTIHDVGEHEGLHYIVMEFVQGTSLANIIKREGALEPARIVNIVMQIASALDYAHALGLVHRDVKPGNIMIGAGDHATLTDFGIVKAAEGTRVTKSGMMIGTPEYISPEQIRGQAVDARADVYALGVVCFEMLAGRVPFQGDTARVLYAQAHEPPPALHLLRQGLPPTVEQVINTALAKDPAQRYARAGEFARALGAAVDGMPIAQPRLPKQAPQHYVPQPHTRKPSSALLPVLAGVAGAVVLLCVMVATALMARQPSTIALAPTHATTTNLSSTAVPISVPSVTLAPTATPRVIVVTATPIPTPTATATPRVIVVTATPIPTPTATATPLGPQKRLDPQKHILDGREFVQSVNISDLVTTSQHPFIKPDVKSGGKYSIHSTTWSIDGKKVLNTWYYHDDYECRALLEVIDADGSTRRILVNTGCWWYLAGALWSPDGQKIAVFWRGLPVSRDICPVLLNLDGTGLKKLPFCEADDEPRFWSVDGKWVIAWSMRGLRLYAYEVEGNRRVPLEQLGKIRVYDQRYWPWRITDSPVCKKPSFWDCE